ncbi:MAG: hypothetical protein WCG25_00660 [bacterium]
MVDITPHIMSHINVFHINCRQLKLLGSSPRFLVLGVESFNRDQLLTSISFNILYEII